MLDHGIEPRPIVAEHAIFQNPMAQCFECGSAFRTGYAVALDERCNHVIHPSCEKINSLCADGVKHQFHVEMGPAATTTSSSSSSSSAAPPKPKEKLKSKEKAKVASPSPSPTSPSPPPPPSSSKRPRVVSASDSSDSDETSAWGNAPEIDPQLEVVSEEKPRRSRPIKGLKRPGRKPKDYSEQELAEMPASTRSRINTRRERDHLLEENAMLKAELERDSGMLDAFADRVAAAVVRRFHATPFPGPSHTNSNDTE